MTGPARPEGRYGPPARPVPRRVLVTAAAAAVLLAVGWAAWVSFGPGRVRVHAQDVAFTTLDETRAQVVFELSKPEDATAVCTVRATNAGFAEVGRTDVRIGPSASGTTTVTAVVPTSERATGGNVKACALV